MVALANIAGLQQVTQFALEHLWQPGDAIHEIYVEDSSAAGEPDLSMMELEHGPCAAPWLGKIRARACLQHCRRVWACDSRHLRTAKLIPER